MCIRFSTYTVYWHALKHIIMNKSYIYLLISIGTFIIGYVFLKTAYLKTQEVPFLNEIILFVLGTIVTIAITSALLNKQSEVELEKEQRVKIFDLKSSLYFDLINFIEGVIHKKEITAEDLVRLEFLTHKISVIANIEVLKEYASFVRIVKKVSQDTDITKMESKELSLQLNKLCAKIRYDLIIKEKNTAVDLKNLIEDQNN